LSHANTSKNLSVSTPPSAEQLTGKMQYFFKTILASKGGYFADKLYSISKNNEQEFDLIPVAKQKKPQYYWLILGREHYFETSKDYPISNKRDLKKALEFDDNKAPFQGVTLQHIERINEQSHRVTFWVINPQVFTTLSFRPWLILPESYILAKGLPSQTNIATIECENKTLFLANSASGIVSGIKSKVINTIEHFALSTGTSANSNETLHLTASNAEFSALLHQGIKLLTFTKLQGFLVASQKRQWKSYPWKSMATISCIMLTIYLALTSAWLVYEEYSVNKQLNQQKSTLNHAFSLQKQYKQQEEKQRLLVVPLKEQIPYWNVWPVVLACIDVGSQITGLHYKNNKIIFHGTAKKGIKATDILAALSENKAVLSPEFSKPVRKNRGREQFAISFTLNADYQQIANSVASKDKENLHGS
jgi:hypothetical protein